MRDAQSRTTYLKDYRPPPFTIERTELRFDLYEDRAEVSSRLELRRNQAQGADQSSDTIVLHGQELLLTRLCLNGEPLETDAYLVDDESLTIAELSRLTGVASVSEFVLEIHTRIEPQNNTALEGLYKSKRMFCTQCEAEGFRRITYYLDRPDVMSRFTTTICAEKKRYPVLLSNGNNIANGTDPEDNGRHWVTWEDPFRKPSYLFALVAGDLEQVEGSFTTCSNREIALQIFVEGKDLDKCEHAMSSLKRAMRWDEERYGREYDLDIFMIVAVDDFNMGAMENKGLNIFNTSCVLANPKTTTDFAYQRVEGVVAHEYFHNWSGNRVTCRDWFQLSLKEGFTVFRDQEFSADMGSRTVKRIEDVAFLRTVQFAEDAGPMAHSVRPDSYMEISNFYTVTIYEKGAEVVRMISQLLGPEKFRQGTDLYFARYDGQAVTTEQFVSVMEESSDIDLKQFRRWYTQAGTPELEITADYSKQTHRYRLKVSQSCPQTPDQAEKKAFHIPLRIGLLDADGSEYALDATGATDLVLSVTQFEQEFEFDNIDDEPVPSLLRDFSAPVRLKFDYSDDALAFLMIHDSDGFNRWFASQQLGERAIEILQKQPKSPVSPVLIKAFEGVLDTSLQDEQIDRAMVSQLLSLPTESAIIEQAQPADVQGIHTAREKTLNTLAGQLEEKFAAVYALLAESAELERNREFHVDAASIAQRTLRNLALSYLVRTGTDQWLQEANRQFKRADNMTDQQAALRMLVNSEAEGAESLAKAALDEFYQQWSHEPLVVDQWFVVQATCQREGTLQRVKQLLKHQDFTLRNPNKVRSLIGAFCSQNHIGFHAANGEGYEFLADRVLELDKLNPQIASRLLTPLTRWKKFDSDRQGLMQVQLQRIKTTADLSKDVFEIVEKSTV